MRVWLRDLFSESSSASFSRFASLILVLFVCGWVTYLVKTKGLPSPGEFAALALFMSTFYGPAQIKESISRWKDPGGDIRATDCADKTVRQ